CSHTRDNVTLLTSRDFGRRRRSPAFSAEVSRDGPLGVTMLTRFARLATNHAKAVLVVAAVFFVAAGAGGGGVADRLTHAGFENPSSESAKAADVLADQFHTGAPNVVLVVTARSGDVDDPAVVEAGRALTAELAAEPDATGVISYWSENNAPPLRNEDGSRALVVGRLAIDEA